MDKTKELLAKGELMSAQNRIQPGVPFAGSSYDPNVIKTIQLGSPVLSSQDVSGEFSSLGATLNQKTKTQQQLDTENKTMVSQGYDSQGNRLPDPNTPPTTMYSKDGGKTGVQDPNAPKIQVGTDGKPIVSETPLYDKMVSDTATNDAKALADAETKKQQVADLLPKTLALIDDQYNSSVQNIQNTYTKLIDEQTRINRVKIDRTKSYGINDAGGQYQPLEYTDAVSDQEQIASNKIASLEGERNNLLATAKQNRDNGNISALRQNMTDLDKIETDMRAKTKELNDVVQKRYELAVSVRKEQETKQKERAKSFMLSAQTKYVDEFDKAKTEQEKDAIIKKIILNSGGTLTDADRYDLYSALVTASEAKLTKVADEEKAKMEMRKGEAQINASNASASNAWANALKTKKETALLGAEGDKPLSIAEVENFQLTYPDAGILPGDTKTQAEKKAGIGATQGERTGTSTNGTKITLKADGTIVDAQGNRYDSNGDLIPSSKIKTTATVVAPKASPTSAIEKRIAEYGNGKFTTADIRHVLRTQGFSDVEIADSSVGNIVEKMGVAVNELFSPFSSKKKK